MKRNRKGFTVLELIIIIGIIGALSGIMIPVFANLNNRSKNTNDQSLVKNLNSRLAVTEADNNTVNATFSQALAVLEEHGFTLDDLRSQSGDTLLWNEKENRFLLESQKDNSIADINYWTIIDEYNSSKQKYSMYATDKVTNETIDNLTKGFDCGTNVNIKLINYVRQTGEEQTTKIVTNQGTSLYIDAPNDTLRHYGRADKVTIKAIKSTSYHEYGSVNHVDLTKGRLVLEKTSAVKEVELLGEDVIIATTLKRLLPNIVVLGARKVILQVVEHDFGRTLSSRYGYLDNNGHFILNNADNDGLIVSDDLKDEVEDEIDETPTEELKEKDITIAQLSDGELLALNLMKKNAINASVNGSIGYKDKVYPMTGTLILNSDKFEINSYQLDLVIDLGFKELSLQITNILDEYYVTIGNQHYYLGNADVKTLIDSLNDIDDALELPSSFLSFVYSQVKQKYKGMSSVKDEHSITYTCRLLDDMNPIIFKSDLNYNLTSIEISNLEDAGYTFNALINVNNMGETKIDLLPNDYSYLSLGFASMDEDTRNGIINQLSNIVNTSSTGISYDIEVTRNNELTFNTEGRIDIARYIDNGEEDLRMRLAGQMVNPDSDEVLNASYDIAYLNDNVYFSYQNRLKLKYSTAGLEGLIDIIKERLTDNEAFKAFAETFMPDNSSKDAPLFDILFSSHNYIEFISYFDGLTKENGNYVLHFNAGLMGLDEGEVTFTLNTNSNGINTINMNNLYAYGYELNGTLRLTDYHDVAINNENEYTPLDYFNNAFDQIFNLFEQKKAHLSLSGYITDKDNKTTSLNGSAYFALTDTKNWGVGNIVINDKENRNHNVTIDVTNVHAGPNATETEKNQAFNNSEVLFNYNNNLKGYFTLGSIMDIYDLIHDLATSNDERFEKYKEYLLEDISRSTIARLLKDEVESILYNDMITNVSYSNNTYTIKINGNFLKKNDLYKCDYIYIDVRLDNSHNLKGITVRSDKVLDTKFNISLDLLSWDNSYTRLVKTSDYKDFSDLKTLAEYLLNTAKRNDFHVSGTLKVDLNLLKIIHPDMEDVPLDAYVHIERDNEGKEKVYSRVEMEIPYYSSLVQNSSEWKDRKFYVYFTDRDVYLRVKTRTDSKEKSRKEAKATLVKQKWSGYWHDWEGRKVEWKEQYYTCQDIKLTMEEFFDNFLYYIFNFGFDLKEDLSSYSGQNNNLDYSKIISDYHYSKNNGIPTWNASLNMKELTTKDNFNNLNLDLTGNTTTKEMSTIHATLGINVIKIIDINVELNASLDNTVISSNRLTDIKDYINFNSTHTNKAIYTSTYTYIAKSEVTVDYVNYYYGWGKDGVAPAKFIGWDKVNIFSQNPQVGDICNLSPSNYYITRT